jgi:hypothetical protein
VTARAGYDPIPALPHTTKTGAIPGWTNIENGQGFLDPEPVDSGFDELSFRIEKAQDTIVEETFLDVAAAVAFFDDRVLELGHLESSAHPSANRVRFVFDLTTDDPGAGFLVDMVVAATVIPEPATILLLAMGAAAILLRDRWACLH